MRLLVTGAAGFIGSHLADALAERGETVLALDNLSFGRLSHLPKQVALVNCDLGSVHEEYLRKQISEFDPEGVLHLAAIHFIPHCIMHPDACLASNVRGTEVLMRCLQGSSTRKLIFASTLDVYSTADRLHSEEHKPEPTNVYGLSKWLGENIVEYTRRLNNHLSVVTLRFANVYGPRETNPHFIPDLLQAIRDKSTPELRMGYLGASRDFIYVLDIVDAVLRAYYTETGRYSVFNVASGTSSPVRKVAELVQNLTGDTRPLIEDQQRFRRFDRATLSANTSRLREATGWAPKWTLESGIRELLAAEWQAS
jgi:UDP-glucose 4-epimerase